jgi:hypothetical protein
MCPQPQEGPAAQGLSDVLLHLVRHERQIAHLRDGLGDFSHRCRNLLNGMKISLYFLRKGGVQSLPPWWGEIEDGYRGLEGLFDTLQRIYRPMPLTTIRAEFGSLVRDRERTWTSMFGRGGQGLVLVPPKTEEAGHFDPNCLGTALDAFVHWRAHAGAHGRGARLHWRTVDGHVLVAWEEPAPSGGGERADLAAGERWMSTGPCSTEELSLPLLARVMTAHGGVLRWTREPEFQVRLRWPLVVALPSLGQAASA